MVLEVKTVVIAVERGMQRAIGNVLFLIWVLHTWRSFLINLVYVFMICALF